MQKACWNLLKWYSIYETSTNFSFIYLANSPEFSIRIEIIGLGSYKNTSFYDVSQQ